MSAHTVAKQRPSVALQSHRYPLLFISPSCGVKPGARCGAATATKSVPLGSWGTLPDWCIIQQAKPTDTTSAISVDTQTPSTHILESEMRMKSSGMIWCKTLIGEFGGLVGLHTAQHEPCSDLCPLVDLWPAAAALSGASSSLHI